MSQDSLQLPPPLTFSVWVAGILRRRRLVLGIVLGTVLVLVVAGLVLPPSYRASATFVTNPSTGGRLPQGLGGASSLQGLTTQLGIGPLSDPSESPNFYSKLVESQELRRRLARSRFPNPRTENPSDSAELTQILGIRHRDALRRQEIAVKRIGNMISVSFDTKTNLVNVTVSSRWPELAAAIANRTVELVVGFNREQRVSRARSKREFLESRLATAYDDLRAAEERQRTFYDQNRLWRNAPSLVFEEGRLRRNVELASDLYVGLRQQFETARLEEINDAALISVVDRAVTPRKAQWPRWGVLLVTATILGGILAVIVAGSAAVIEDWRARNPVAARYFRDSLPARLRRRRRVGADAVAS